MDFCTCPSCKRYQVTLADGQTRQGLYVDQSTRRRHWAKSAKQGNSVLNHGLSELSLSNESNPQNDISTYENNTPSDPDSNEINTYGMANSNLIDFILYFIMWLYLVCGISREKCRRARDMVINIIKLTQKNNITSSQLSSVPFDIRTISKKLELESSFDRHVCCPRCYSLYDIEEPACTTSTSNLWSNPITWPATPRNPQATFISQSILSWITWLLNIPGVEAKLEQWEHNLSSHEGEVVFDVTQAVVCKRELDQLSSDQSFQLKFALFVDWFNPRGNKLSGKQLLMGLLVFYCLNLQPQERFQPRFSCLAGVIPSPNQPDMITINNILKPTIDELLEIKKVKTSTPSHPHGRNVSIKLVALIGDIVATHQVSGFMSHLAKYFCSSMSFNTTVGKN
ncbi:hypothetical protein O181_049852 [Austropuccinia psidii MF-1]|uniref:Uncharacterized protein n=1 Tax=Austropuccinia psidii MF-1 TaxID=1389203 RepID=A0A9Q3E2K1_9BASI|nr:hypothetical protein [Austropuccinia psidii MF-1]